MIGWVARLLLFRLLPRKIVPIITIVEIGRLLWLLRRRRYAVNESTYSPTAQPPSWPDGRRRR